MKQRLLLLLLALPFVAGCSASNPATGGDAGATDASSGGDGAAPGSDGGGAPVGAPCLPYQELSQTFAGFGAQEVTVNQGDPACASGVCLVNHFRGRTSCAYGQGPDGTGNGGGAGCKVPGTGAPVTPSDPHPNVLQWIAPQCTDRSPSADVTCSCRCANPEGKTDDGASYCTCPTGTVCAQVVPGFVSGDPLAGGYCVPPSSTYHQSSYCAATCDPATNNCPETTAALPSSSGQGTTYFLTTINFQGSPFPPQCVPVSLPVDASGKAKCEVYYLLTAGDACANHAGLSSPDPAIASAVNAARQEPMSPLPVCLLQQLPATPCASSSQAGWCYLSGSAATNGCAQEFDLSPPAMPPAGVIVALACP